MFGPLSDWIRVSLTICVLVRVGFAADNDAARPPAKHASTRRLLEKLAEQNAGDARFKDAWCRTLKEIVELGTDAVPELIMELDATSDDMMLRCLGFTLRGIGDPRAVPALIRAIPMTFIPSGGSDMVLKADDPDLMTFAKKFDLSENDPADRYSFGRPVREICGAICKLTGQTNREQELYSVNLRGLPSQRRMKKGLFYDVAQAWSEWWEQNWSRYVQDEKYSKVHLREFDEGDSLAHVQLHTNLKTEGGSSNMILESVFDPKAKRVFFDLDVGRYAGLPEKWREGPEIHGHMEEIVGWARDEGFDLMGTEHQTLAGQKVFAIQPIGMEVWELPRARWKARSQRITLQQLQAEGQGAESLLFHFDEAAKSVVPLETASFLYITSDKTPGLLYVGVEVQEVKFVPGRLRDSDPELKPFGHSKGRRFGYLEFELSP